MCGVRAEMVEKTKIEGSETPSVWPKNKPHAIASKMLISSLYPHLAQQSDTWSFQDGVEY